MTKEYFIKEFSKIKEEAIEKRWKPITKGVPYSSVPRCNFCDFFYNIFRNTDIVDFCEFCPLFNKGYNCSKYFEKFLEYRYRDLRYAKAILNKIKKIDVCKLANKLEKKGCFNDD
jgi:hypothetical protein